MKTVRVKDVVLNKNDSDKLFGININIVLTGILTISKKNCMVVIFDIIVLGNLQHF